jgi:hypothetical protein
MKEVGYLAWNFKNVKLMTIPLDPMNVSPKPILIIIIIGVINGNKDLILKIHQRLIPYGKHYFGMSFKQVFKSKKQVGTLFLFQRFIAFGKHYTCQFELDVMMFFTIFQM